METADDLDWDEIRYTSNDGLTLYASHYRSPAHLRGPWSASRG